MHTSALCYAYVSAIRMQELIRSIGHASPTTRLHMYAYAIRMLTCAMHTSALCYAYVSAIRMQELIRSIGHASPKTRLHTYAYAIRMRMLSVC
jgi:hypothetical protein